LTSSAQTTHAEEKETGRLEAFSDGVFSIAMTLLVLDLKVPHLGNGASTPALASALAQQWPSYLSFVMSFFTVLIMWVNHHIVFRLVRKTNARLLFANGFLLLLVTAVPFTTALLSEYLTKPGAAVACAVYAGTFVLISVAYNLLWHVAARGRALLKSDAPEHTVQRITRNYMFGPPLYLSATVSAFVSTYVSVGICFGLWVFWAVTTKER
jgi:uncharacterized membrane protein